MNCVERLFLVSGQTYEGVCDLSVREIWGDVDPTLKDWVSTVGRGDLSLEWSAEWLLLNGADSFFQAQKGYAGEGWSDDWFVIGNVCGDPVFLDGASGEVAFAKHGVACWVKNVVSENLEQFCLVLNLWCDVFYVKYGGSILDESFEIVASFLSDVESGLLALGLGQNLVNNFMKLVSL